jgi:hypothetical protein
MATFTLGQSGNGEGGELVLLPAGTPLLAEVVKVEVKDHPFFWKDKDDHSKGKQEQVAFTFKVIDEEFFGRFVYGDTPTTFNDNERCKLRRWVEEIFAFDNLAPGFEFETDTLVANPVYVVMRHDTYNDKITGEPKTVQRVDTLIRFEGGYEESSDDAF